MRPVWFASDHVCGYYFLGIIVNEIILPQPLFDAMLEHLESCLPEEACGLIGGTVVDGSGYAVRLFPIENMLHSPVAYEMEPLQQIQAMIAIENDGLDLTAIYHSHPDGPARPSRSDIAQAYYPDAATIIVSHVARQHPSLTAFMIVDGQVTEIPVTRVA